VHNIHPNQDMYAKFTLTFDHALTLSLRASMTTLGCHAAGGNRRDRFIRESSRDISTGTGMDVPVEPPEVIN
jgi:hypothetical protein